MKRLFLVLSILLIFTATCFSQIMDKPAATINYYESDIITEKQLDIAVNQLSQQYSMAGQQPPSRGEILEELIISKLILQAAKKDKMSVTESEVKVAIRTQLGPSGVNVTDEQLKMLIRQQTRMELVCHAATTSRRSC